MEKEPGDDYIRKCTAFIRTNEQRLADLGIIRRPARTQRPSPNANSYNILGWMLPAAQGAQPPPKNVKPLVLQLDLHHLFYLLMRFEELGIDVGSLDVHMENVSRPFSYISMLSAKDKAETLSIASSIRSGVSSLSLGGGWWGPPPPKVDEELKYLYSSYTKLPALSLQQAGLSVITELADDPPTNNAVPLDAFKNLQSLECLDIDPRALLGWDRLAEGLRSLTIKRSGLADLSDILIDAVVDDQARREGKPVKPRGRRLVHRPSRSRRPSYTGDPISPVLEAEEERTPTITTPLPQLTPRQTDSLPVPGYTEEGDLAAKPPAPTLPSLKWAFLKHLCLAENAMTFIPTAPLAYLTSLTHLDLSSNLLVSVPPGLNQLYSLVSLNLSDNMIDSVLGIYTVLGSVLVLNLSRNRLDSLCGLERLAALERVDLRNNRLEDSGEVGRLAPLPNIAQVWVDGNPFVRIEEEFRIKCFDYFAREGKEIVLDDTPPSYYERKSITATLNQLPAPAKLTASSPPVVPVGGGAKPPTPTSSNPSSTVTTPQLAPTSTTTPGTTAPQPTAVVSKPKRKVHKRIVNLDGGVGETSDEPVSAPRLKGGHSRRASDGSVAFGASPPRGKTMPKPVAAAAASVPADTGATGAAAATSSSKPAPVPEEAPTNPEQEATAAVGAGVGAIKASSPPRMKIPGGAAATIGRQGGHGRSPTELGPPSALPRRLAGASGSATISSSAGGRGSRRARVSASVYEPYTPPSPGSEGGSPGNGSANGSGGAGTPVSPQNDAEAFRAKIEALRAEVGDSWLKVLNQSQMVDGRVAARRQSPAANEAPVGV